MASRAAEKPRHTGSLGVAVGAVCASVTALVGSESSNTTSATTSTLAAPTKKRENRCISHILQIIQSTISSRVIRHIVSNTDYQAADCTKSEALLVGDMANVRLNTVKNGGCTWGKRRERGQKLA